MNRSILISALLVVGLAALDAQEPAPSNPYEGVSTPPAQDATTTATTPKAKPRAGHPVTPSQVPDQEQAPESAQVLPDAATSSASAADPDSGIVRPPEGTLTPEHPALAERPYAADPDGDIVHPRPPGPGELGEGTTLRVKLLDRLSTANSEKGEAFHSRVSTDVLSDGQILIPAGAEIDGHVVEVSSGRPGGHGTMRLRPETVILPNGTRFQLHADLSGTPGSKTKVGTEGTVRPNSRLKRDGIEYAGAVGAGAVTGAIVAGPAGALTGGLIGAGVVTVHLLVSHPQATLEPGTTLLFTLSEPLSMVQAGSIGN